jgi:hypothetical protein
MSSGSSQTLMQYLGLAPYLIACLVGFILALVYWNRVPGPARMTCLAVVLMVVTLVGQMWAQQYVIENSAATGSSGMQISQTLSLIGFIGGIIHAGALGLLIAAVFMGRRAPTEHRGFQVMPGAPGWPQAPPPPQMPPLGPRG